MDLKNIKSEDLKKYGASYSDRGLMNKVIEYATVIGKELIFKILQLWYVLQKPEVPMEIKAIVIGALGYFISPVDVIPDFIPGIGYTDDAAVIAFALLVAAMYVDEDVNEKARKKMESIFGAY